MNCYTIFAGIFGVALMHACASAAVVYSYVTDAQSYDIASGTSVVHVSLLESLDSESSVIVADSGLFAAGFRVSRINGSGVTISAFTPAPLFAGPFSITPALPWIDVSFTVSSDLNAPSFPTPDETGKIALGALTLALDGNSDGAGFQISAMVDGGNTVTYENAYDLDVDNELPAFVGAGATTNAFSVVVPEPVSLVGLLVFTAMLARPRRQSRGIRSLPAPSTSSASVDPKT